ncbi:GDSL-type esterase/lipase family protein [Lentisphaera profundi]|uniref:GDSL-type esterase/lipase family protein n=1 Tax=Lentisphaera profundi TaxID=1658616 RepID=A0ABY7VYS0_9BACT|nr:GDSL-type esterase/lipase family protein [Lentisphaera profundi]WDE99423.1 GDSL-type esterase/lipase family protein [Lentisphaera profundi]
MKTSIIIAIVCLVNTLVHAAPPTYPDSVPKPTQTNVAYGAHQGQLLDFWMAPSASSSHPTPLVFYIHGGSWQTGSKELIRGCVDVKALLEAGISVVAINYRYVSQAKAAGITPPVKAPLNDAARALQFVRSKALEWHVNTTRIGATGASAGGCSSLWLAYHDDMADPASLDPIARQSTRLFCASVRVPQTSLDPQQMKDWLGRITYGGHAFNVSNQDFLQSRPNLLPWIKEYSPYAHVSADDPPVAIYYDKNLKDDLGAHSPQFAFQLQKRCQELDLFCEVRYAEFNGYRQYEATRYLIKTLKGPAPKNTSEKFNINTSQYSLPAFKKGRRLLFIGDSITDMNRGRNERDRNHYLGHSFVFMIAARLGMDLAEEQLDFYNRGISGNTVAQLKARWQKDAIDMRPDLLTILIGTNDVGKKVKPQSFEDDYRAILSASRKANPKLKIILLDPFVLQSGGLKNERTWNARRSATDQLRPIVAKLAKEFDAVHIKTQDLFDAASKSSSPDYWLWDGIHPLPQGHELIARHWIKALSTRWPQGSASAQTQAPAQATLTCPSGHLPWRNLSEAHIDKSVDGDLKTKWCYVHHDRPLQWQVQLPAPRVVRAYSFTSANDVPKRDPKEWKWHGSMDGVNWNLLDHRKNQPPFAKRLSKRSYTFKNTQVYTFYRLTLLANQGDGHYQFAEIELEGIKNITKP